MHSGPRASHRFHTSTAPPTRTPSLPQSPIPYVIAATAPIRFISALNARDLSGMLQLVSDDCHHVDLSHEAEGHCKEVSGWGRRVAERNMWR